MTRKRATATRADSTVVKVSRYRVSRAHVDGWENQLTGLGVNGRDARTATVVVRPTLTPQECEDLYRGDDMAAKIADEPALEMTRCWIDILIQTDAKEKPAPKKPVDETQDPFVRGYRSVQRARARLDAMKSKDQAEGIEKKLEELDAQQTVCDAIAKARAYGGSVIVIGIDDGSDDPAQPLDEEQIKDVAFLTVFDATEAYPATWYTDVFHPKYGQPETYWILPQGVGLSARATSDPLRDLNVGSGNQIPLQGAGSGVAGGKLEGRQAVLGGGGTVPILRVHESRCLRFNGVLVSRRHARENRGWGDSVYVRVLHVLMDFGMAWGSTAALIKDFGQAVYKLAGLAELVASNDPEDQKALGDRLAMLDASRSVLRAVVLDNGSDPTTTKGDDFDRKPTPIAGLAEILDRFCNRLAAAADMPVTRLMGQSPAGLNATGEADVTWWYDRIAAQQPKVMRKQLNRLVELVMRAKSGPTRGVVPDNWSIRFRPLRELSPTEEADRRLKVAQADHIYVTDQVITPEETAVSRFAGDEFSAETQLDDRLRDEFGAIEPDDPDGPGITEIANAAHTAAKAGVEIPGVPTPTREPLDVQLAKAKAPKQDADERRAIWDDAQRAAELAASSDEHRAARDYHRVRCAFLTDAAEQVDDSDDVLRYAEAAAAHRLAREAHQNAVGGADAARARDLSRLAREEMLYQGVDWEVP